MGGAIAACVCMTRHIKFPVRWTSHDHPASHAMPCLAMREAGTGDSLTRKTRLRGKTDGLVFSFFSLLSSDASADYQWPLFDEMRATSLCYTSGAWINFYQASTHTHTHTHAHGCVDQLLTRKHTPTNMYTYIHAAVVIEWVAVACFNGALCCLTCTRTHVYARRHDGEPEGRALQPQVGGLC